MRVYCGKCTRKHARKRHRTGRALKPMVVLKRLSPTATNPKESVGLHVKAKPPAVFRQKRGFELFLLNETSD